MPRLARILLAGVSRKSANPPPYRDITDPVESQREMRDDRPLVTQNEHDFQPIPQP